MITLRQANSATTPRPTKTRFLSLAGATALLLTGIFLHADSDGNQSERGLAGTWISTEGGGAQLTSFMSDGRAIGSVPINIATHNGPGGGNELAAPSHGEWIRTGNREFASTSFSILSSPDAAAGFTHLIKLTGNWRLNKTSDELTLESAMIGVYLPDGTLQFPAFPGAVTHFKRVIVGQ